MKIDYLTLFPEMFDGVLNHSILKRAQDKNIIEVNTVNFRDYAKINIIKWMIIRMVAVKEWF